MSAVAINVIGSVVVRNHYRSGVTVDGFNAAGEHVSSRHFLRITSFSTAAIKAAEAFGFVADGVGMLTEKKLDNGTEFIVTDK